MSTQDKRITNYRAFWPYYVSQHRNKTNRNFHFLGTALTLFVLFETIVQLKPFLLLALPFTVYGFGWLGHYLLEKNKPVSFRYPLWSLRADFEMFFFMCAMRMDREANRMGVLDSEN